MWRRVVLLVAVLLTCGFAMAISQTPENTLAPAQPAPPRPQFFAGSVIEVDQKYIKVSRTLVGRPTETRTFVVNAGTKMNKNALKAKVRVTVRYKRMPEGDIALEIQVRPAVRSAKG
jgi:hypothetical protein